jgi:hypothetical protein
MSVKLRMFQGNNFCYLQKDDAHINGTRIASRTWLYPQHYPLVTSQLHSNRIGKLYIILCNIYEGGLC